VRIHQLDLRNFRGFEAVSLIPSDHVLLVGQPGAGRFDIIVAIDRALSPDSTRGRLPNELDFNRRRGDQPAEVEVVLGRLGEALEQMFFDHLEVWDLDGRQLVTELADPETIDRERFDLALRLCYRDSRKRSRRPEGNWTQPSRNQTPSAQITPSRKFL